MNRLVSVFASMVLLCVFCIADTRAEERVASVLDDVIIRKVSFDNTDLVEVLETLRLMSTTTYRPTWYTGTLAFQYSFDPRKSFRKVTYNSSNISLRKLLSELLSSCSIELKEHDDRLEFVDAVTKKPLEK